MCIVLKESRAFNFVLAFELIFGNKHSQYFADRNIKLHTTQLQYLLLAHFCHSTFGRIQVPWESKPHQEGAKEKQVKSSTAMGRER